MNSSSKRLVMVPLDHGVSMGPLPGLVEMKKTLEAVIAGGADCVVLHKGIVKHVFASLPKHTGLLIHLSASTEYASNPFFKKLSATVEDALMYGADGISMQVNFGGAEEQKTLHDFGTIASSCDRWGLPLLAMAYPKEGKAVKDPIDVAIPFVARVVYELGADIIKVPYTGSSSSFRKVTSCVDVPVIIAGGSKLSPLEFLSNVEDALSAGAAGVSVGRNIFQAKNPTTMVRAVCDVVHKGIPAKEVVKDLDVV